MPTFEKIVLYTDADGFARFRTETIALSCGTQAAALSDLMGSQGYQLRRSPIGFRSQFHCTVTAQWVFILQGQMQIGLQDGSTRIFKAGEHFYSADHLPLGAKYDPNVHGHWSAQVGSEELTTLFVRG